IYGGSGYFGAVSGGLSYSRRANPIGISANVASSARYFPRNDTWVSFQSAAAGADFSHGLWSHARFRANPTVNWANHDRLDFFDQPDQEEIDVAFVDQQDYAVI